MTASEINEGILPVVTVRVNGITCRALIDTGAGSSYASAKLLDLIKKKPCETKTRRVDMLISSRVTKLEVYDTVVEALDGSYQMSVKLTKVKKGELLSICNPKYDQLIHKYSHLQGVEIADHDIKEQLPVHVVLGSGEYARTKTDTRPQIGREGEPVGEKTKLGWFIMSPGTEFDHNTMLLTQTSQSDYEDLCRLDVLGLADTTEHDQGVVHTEFKEQLQRSPEGWYETGLPWRGNHPTLPTNEQGSLRRLSSLIKKLERDNIIDEYDGIIREQIEGGIVEIAAEEVKGTEFYIPHKAVIREAAETTKMRIVYDASAKATQESPSLNECLYPGPSLQNKLWDVLVRQRAYPVVVAGDIRKAFLQIRIRECERDALRFHWRKGRGAEIEVLRFTRALFGLAPSPFLLAGVLEAHLDAWEEREPEMVAELRRALYVDDLLTGGRNGTQAKQRKEKVISILGDATFELHKWNSNLKQLEEENIQMQTPEDQTYAKQQLNVNPTKSKMLGLKWDKQRDTLSVVIPTEEVQPTKRSILAKLAKIYDPLGLVAPITLTGKQIYRDVCETKAPWDAQLKGDLLQQWKKWEQQLPQERLVPRAIARFEEDIEEVELHSFRDASKGGVGAAVYAVVRQQSGITQQLVAAKSRLAKQGLTIPRLELVSAHMATNLLMNVRNALDNITPPKLYGWLDSTVALYWIKGNGQYKEFVANRVAKIQLQKRITWRYVPSEENPADLASRGGQVKSSELWMTGPEWLHDENQWPDNPVTQSSPASQAEAKLTREVLSVARPIRDEFHDLLEENSLWRTLRICAWVNRFQTNCRKPKSRRNGGPLTTEELEQQKLWWTRKVQNEAAETKRFQADKIQLNLRPNGQGIMECRGRIVGVYPIYLPDDHLFTAKFVQQAHSVTLHGGVTLTMAKVRETHWIPRLRSLVKKVRRSCWGCKRFQVKAYQSPPPGNLPVTRTQGMTPFENVGVDFAGPIKYRVKPKQEGKAYLVLYACCLTRGVFLDVLPTLQTDKFLASLKKFIARRGRPRYIYSDNGSTFKAAADWLKKVRKCERFHDRLAQLEIDWKFNLSRAPWWGGQFERLIGIFKSTFHKVVGNGFLSWNELCDLVLDVEVAINNRPLSYLEDDVELPVLTPSTMLYLRSNQIPQMNAHQLQDADLRKRAKYLDKCKIAVWSRWTKEYIRSLRERHNKCGGEQTPHPSVGEVVIIQDESRDRNTWKLGIIEELIVGRDGIVRGAKLRAGRGILERAVQQLYPLELSVDRPPKPRLDPVVPPFRPRRNAAAVANLRMQDMTDLQKD